MNQFVSSSTNRKGKSNMDLFLWNCILAVLFFIGKVLFFTFVVMGFLVIVGGLLAFIGFAITFGIRLAIGKEK